MDYKVKAKVNGKYFTFGNIKDGQYGPRLGLRNTPELKELIRQGGEWINFSLFEDDGGPTKAQPAAAPRPAVVDDQEIPF